MEYFTKADIKKFVGMKESEAIKFLSGITDDEARELSIDADFELWDALNMTVDEQETVNKLMDIVDDVPYGFYKDNEIETLNDWLGANGRHKVTDKVKRLMMVHEEDAERWRVMVDSPETEDDEEPEKTLAQVLALYAGDDEWDVTGEMAQGQSKK